MESYKQKEIEYYNKEAEDVNGEAKESGSLGGFDPYLLLSYKFLQKLVNENCRRKKVLDYGCGMGVHLENLAKVSREVIGIDLSEKSLGAANKILKEKKIGNATVILMDLEKREFAYKSVYVFFDYGTFSSIYLQKVLSEISKNFVFAETSNIFNFFEFVDDELIMRIMLLEILSAAGYIVDMAQNGKKALDIFNNNIYDLVISDVHMPEMDGITFYSKAKERLPELNKKFLFLTGNITNEVLSFFKVNNLEYITKPFQIPDILGRIGSMIKEDVYGRH